MLRPQPRISSTVHVGHLDPATLLLRTGKISTAQDSKPPSLTVQCQFTLSMNCRRQRLGAEQCIESTDTSLSSPKPQSLVSSRYVRKCHLRHEQSLAYVVCVLLDMLVLCFLTCICGNDDTRSTCPVSPHSVVYALPFCPKSLFLH